MPRGASPKRERQYEHNNQSASKSGRYGGRAEEVAARTVNKIRAEKGETKSKRSSVKKTSRTAPSRSRSRKPTTPRAKKAASKSSKAAARAKSASSKRRGFAGMSEQRQRAIAAQGGRAAHKRGTAHEFSPTEARQAGQKGGESVSRDRRHMAKIGRRGGEH